MCEGKRRAHQKDEKRVQTGFRVFNRYFEISQFIKIPKSYEEFCKSPYYSAFVKFGSFINNVSPIYPDKFIDYVIKSGIKLDDWCKDEVYEKYLCNMIRVEPVESAVQRSIQTMMTWGTEKNLPYNEYFSQVSVNKAAADIANGHISPWVILNCKSGKVLLKTFNDDHLKIISPVFDFQFWQTKFKIQVADTSLVKEICKEAQID